MNALRPSSFPEPPPEDTHVRERDKLVDRARAMEEALDQIAAEVEHALEHPEISVLTLCRIAARVRQANGSRRG